jgi:signal transduction histidine kinase
MVKPLYRWLTRPGDLAGDSSARLPPEAIMLRTLGLAWLVVFIVDSSTTKPQPSLHGKGIAIGAAMILLVVCAVGTHPRLQTMSQRRRVGMLLGVSVATAVLAATQPHGIWQLGAYFVGILAAMRLSRVTAALTLGGCLLALVIIEVVNNHGGGAVSITVGVVPWFLVIRLLAEMRTRNQELQASQEAEARAAAEAERGRISREMHDVLAHSLSALALQLESARLLARDRDTDPDVTRALDQAHHLAASGLDEARRAIAAARGDELPGPERLGALTEAFEEQSGIPATFSVTGAAHELAPDASLAIYRTAQEALTNVRRHATPEGVELRLTYSAEATVRAVEDFLAAGTPPPPALTTAGGGFGLSGLRERAELLGGRLTAVPTAGGFRVELWLPGEPRATAPIPVPVPATSTQRR